MRRSTTLRERGEERGVAERLDHGSAGPRAQKVDEEVLPFLALTLQALDPVRMALVLCPKWW